MKRNSTIGQLNFTINIQYYLELVVYCWNHFWQKYFICILHFTRSQWQKINLKVFFCSSGHTSNLFFIIKLLDGSRDHKVRCSTLHCIVLHTAGCWYLCRGHPLPLSPHLDIPPLLGCWAGEPRLSRPQIYNYSEVNTMQWYSVVSKYNDLVAIPKREVSENSIYWGKCPTHTSFLKKSPSKLMQLHT